METIEDAKEKFMLRIEDGAECPCCGQYAKLYKRPFGSAMARALVWLVREYERNDRWYNIHEFPLIQGRRGGGDFAKLVHWGLIQERETEDDDTARRASGFWRPTGSGIQFAHRRLLVPKRVHLYNNQIRGWDSEYIDVSEALGKKFDYAELMAS